MESVRAIIPTDGLPHTSADSLQDINCLMNVFVGTSTFPEL
jgi:hypothetical protein